MIEDPGQDNITTPLLFTLPKGTKISRFRDTVLVICETNDDFVYLVNNQTYLKNLMSPSRIIKLFCTTGRATILYQ